MLREPALRSLPGIARLGITPNGVICVLAGNPRPNTPHPAEKGWDRSPSRRAVPFSSNTLCAPTQRFSSTPAQLSQTSPARVNCTEPADEPQTGANNCECTLAAFREERNTSTRFLLSFLRAPSAAMLLKNQQKSEQGWLGWSQSEWWLAGPCTSRFAHAQVPCRSPFRSTKSGARNPSRRGENVRLLLFALPVQAPVIARWHRHFAFENDAEVLRAPKSAAIGNLLEIQISARDEVFGSLDLEAGNLFVR